MVPRGPGPGATLRTDSDTRRVTGTIRATTRVFLGPRGRQAPIFRQESEGGIQSLKFGGEFGSSRAARADGTDAWAWGRRSEQLARMERKRAARTTALGNGGCCKMGEPAGVLFDACSCNLRLAQRSA